MVAWKKSQWKCAFSIIYSLTFMQWYTVQKVSTLLDFQITFFALLPTSLWHWQIAFLSTPPCKIPLCKETHKILQLGCPFLSQWFNDIQIKALTRSVHKPPCLIFKPFLSGYASVFSIIVVMNNPFLVQLWHMAIHFYKTHFDVM